MSANVISILNMKGGVGKTTISCNLAVELAARDKKVLLIDIDPQFNSTQTLFKYCYNNLDRYKELSEKGRTIVGLFRNEDEVAEKTMLDNGKIPYIEALNCSIPEIPSLADTRESARKKKIKIEIIPGDLHLIVDINASAADKLGAYFFKNHLMNEYDYILIDCPPTWGQLTTVALSKSNFYIIPTNLDEFSTMGISILANQLEEKNNSLQGKLKSLGVVYMFLNSTRAGNGIAVAHRKFKEDLEKYLKSKMDEKVKSEVKPFNTMFHKKNYFVTRSAIYRTSNALSSNEDYAVKMSDFTDEVIERIGEINNAK